MLFRSAIAAISDEAAREATAAFEERGDELDAAARPTRPHTSNIQAGIVERVTKAQLPDHLGIQIE